MRRYVEVTLPALCVFGLFQGLLADTLWRAVNVDRDKLTWHLSTDTCEVPSFRWCGTVCDKTPTCQSWNYENKVCSLTDLRVSPFYEATTTDTDKFYTGLEKDFAVGSTVTAFSPGYSVPSNLAKGMYNKNMREFCYQDFGIDNIEPWVLFELQATQKISQVRITTRPYGTQLFKPIGAEVRVGTVFPETLGDFSSYKQLGKFPESVEADTTYSVENTDGITGRFVLIHKKCPSQPLTLCHVVIL